MNFINIGFGNMILAQRIVAIVSPEAAPIKRIVADARGKRELIDATCGRRTRSVVITDSNHIVLSALNPDTVVGRFKLSNSPDKKLRRKTKSEE